MKQVQREQGKCFIKKCYYPKLLCMRSPFRDWFGDSFIFNFIFTSNFWTHNSHFCFTLLTVILMPIIYGNLILVKWVWLLHPQCGWLSLLLLSRMLQREARILSSPIRFKLCEGTEFMTQSKYSEHFHLLCCKRKDLAIKYANDWLLPLLRQFLFIRNRINTLMNLRSN